MVEDKQYTDHLIFQKLEKFSGYYEGLGESTMFILAQGTKAFISLDSYTFTSIQATIESIRDVLANGRIGDAYALLRKYFDAAVINVYTNLYLEDHFSIDNFIVEKIENWRNGKERLPEIREMNSYIQNSEKLKAIWALLYKDKRYSRLRQRGNNHTHYKFYYHHLLNDGKIHLENRSAYFDRISQDLEDVFILHVSLLFYLSDHYMISSDYRDSLDSGLTPEPGSEFYVAPFIQEIFDEVLSKSRPDIDAAIKGRTSMKLS